jgi:hypothetical protein
MQFLACYRVQAGGILSLHSVLVRCTILAPWHSGDRYRDVAQKFSRCQACNFKYGNLPLQVLLVVLRACQTPKLGEGPEQSSSRGRTVTIPYPYLQAWQRENFWATSLYLDTILQYSRLQNRLPPSHLRHSTKRAHIYARIRFRPGQCVFLKAHPALQLAHP